MKRVHLLSTLAVVLLSAAGRAQSAPAPATEAAPFSGWVSLTYTAGDYTETSTWNTETGVCSFRVSSDFRKGAARHVDYKNPATGDHVEYLSHVEGPPGAEVESTGSVKLGTLDPTEGDMLRIAGAAPLTFTALLAQAKAQYGEEGIKVAEDTDRGLKRYALEWADKTKEKPLNSSNVRKSHFRLEVPSVVWVDPKTGLVRETDGGWTLVYNVPPVASVYDAGAPRDAKVVDCRPTAETARVFERVMGRIHQPLPDGVAALATVSENKGKPANTQVVVYGLAGHNWAQRTYRVGAADEPAALALPDDWYAAGSALFFQKLASTLPTQTVHSDGITMWTANIDPATGQESHWIAGRGSRVLPGPGSETGRAAQVAESGPTTKLYPLGIIGRYRLGNTLELVTSPERPGLVALSVRQHYNSPDVVNLRSDFWIDPRHDDRPVTYVWTSYKVSKTQEVGSEMVTEFGEYATLPAPDGRSYPTLWTRVEQRKDDTGQFSETIRETTRFHFFPGKKLPDVPNPPQKQP